jgi:hypothetical protein
LRAGLFVAFRLEVAAQRRFALGVGPCLEIVRHFLQHLDVGRDALGLDGTARRRELTRRGEPQPTVARAERNDGLHRAFTERARADQRRAFMVLQRAGDDSDAEADPPLINTMTGLPLVRSPGRALKRWVSSALRPRGGHDLSLV